MNFTLRLLLGCGLWRLRRTGAGRQRAGPDGRGWDQALWAEAVVVLADGTKLRLQDLPWIERDSANPFAVSFVYHGQPSTALLTNWTRLTREESLDERRTRRTVTWLDPATGLEVRLDAVQFRDFPAVEWGGYLKNTASTNTPVLEDIQVFDGPVPVPGTGPSVLHWAKGGVASFDDFAPQETALKQRFFRGS